MLNNPKLNRKQDKRLLIIDDEENMRHMLSAMLGQNGYLVDVAANGKDALEKVAAEHYDIILCDVKMPGMDGIGFLKSAQPHIAKATIIMMSAYGTIDMAVEAMQLGAYDFISKPFKSQEIRIAINKAEEREQLRSENQRLKEKISQIAGKFTFHQMVARSKPMQEVFALAQKVAQFDTTVLITGESGTGKELIASGIHHLSPRAQRPMVPVNCGSIPENLLESELFGHVKGAFTGAERDKKGLFEEAHGGTIFLDEIGELPLQLQVTLLRVLQENELRPLGSARTKKIDARVIAATSRNLLQDIKAGSFREDLYYRLNVMPLQMPPLRVRSEDIPLLSQYFVERFNEILGRGIEGITPAAMTRLLQYQWPGNVRELENVIERAMVLAEDSHIGAENLPPELGAETAERSTAALLEGYSLKEAQRRFEEQMIIKALKATGGNRTKASQLLEISHPSLLSKMKTYHIEL